MKNIGAGTGGAFSTFEYMPTTGEGASKSKAPSTAPPWLTTHVKGRLFNKDTLPLLPGQGNTQMLDMKRYAPSGGRPQFDDKRRSVQVCDTVTSVLLWLCPSCFTYFAGSNDPLFPGIPSENFQ
jgi:hypothetical protein